MSDNDNRKHFRGTWARPELFRLVRKRKVSARAAWLMMVIDSFTSGKRGECFASNDYLAAEMGIDPRHVRRMIGELRDAGLLQYSLDEGHTRHLRTCWPDKNVQGPRTKMSMGGGHSRHPHDEDSSLAYVDEDSARQAGSHRVAISIRLPAVTRGPREHCTHCRGTDWEEMARRLGKAWAKVRRHDPEYGLKSSASGLRTTHVRGAPLGRLQQVLRWYCRMVRDEGDINTRNPNYWPVTLSGSSWPDKWQKLEAAFERHVSVHGLPAGEKSVSAKTGKPLFSQECDSSPEAMRKAEEEYRGDGPNRKW